MTGSSLAAIISTAFSVNAAAIGVGGLPGIISIFPKYMAIFALAMAVALVVPFVLTVIVGKKKIDPNTGELYAEETEEVAAFTDAQKDETMIVPVSGKIIPITEVEDAAFSSKAMGDGFAVVPKAGQYSGFGLCLAVGQVLGTRGQKQLGK